MPSPAFVQSAFKAAGAVTSSTLAYPSNVGAASLKVAHVISNNTTGVVGASDNLDSTYNVDVTLTNTTAGPVDGIMSKPNATAGATTVTFTVTVSAQLRALIEEFSGVATTTPFDKSASTSSGGTQNTSPNSGASAATTQSVELVIGNCGLVGSQTITAGSGYTLDNPSGTTRIGAEYLVTSVTGAQTATFSLGASTQWVAMVATYKGAGAGTNYSLNCAAGSFAMNGQAADVHRGPALQILCNTGVFDFSGAPSAADYALNANAGVFSFSGAPAGGGLNPNVGVTPYWPFIGRRGRY